MACVSGVPENYDNIKVIVEKLKLNDFTKEFKVVADFKLINIFNGLQSRSSRYPCAYGKCKKPTKSSGWIKGEDRTFQNIINDQNHGKTPLTKEDLFSKTFSMQKTNLL